MILRGVLKFAGPETIGVAGMAYPADSINVLAGWNLIGAVGDAVGAADVRESIPGLIVSPFYGFENSYAASNTIIPGRAYWVKVSSAGKLFINVPPPKSDN